MMDGVDKLDLDDIRARIDALDARIQEAISQRASLATFVAQSKRAKGEASDFYRPEREAEVLRKAVERNQGPLSDEVMSGLVQEIMSACLNLQKPLSVAYLGPAGTFTQAAAFKHFGQSIETLSMDGIDAVFREVESGAANYGVVPVENSTEGVVSHTLDMFLKSSLQICGEVELRIHHNLLSLAGDTGAIQRIYSHQQSLAQCRQWLDRHLPGVERVAVSSNADAASRAAGEPMSAAVAGAQAAQTYGLPVLAANIEDEPDNTTRFMVIGTRPVSPTAADKTSLLLSAPNEPGALYQLLEPLAREGVSMTRIESRPSRSGNWHYVFFVDVDGHVEDPAVKQALSEIEAHASVFRILGSYPKAIV